MEGSGGGLLGPALDRLCGPSTAAVQVDGEVIENPTPMTADDSTVPDDELGETVRATNRRASLSGGDDPHAAGATDAQLAASRDAAVAELLGICERNGVTVGPHLRRAILGEEMYDASLASSAGSGRPRRSVYAKRESALTFLARRNNESFHDESVTRDSDVVAEIRKRVDQANVQGAMSFEVRVRDGSFTVDSPVVSGSRKKEAGTQHIPTVTNGGGFFKCYDAVRRLATTGTLRKETETKVIMDGVNLILEQGKMYLILGAPGCGKSVLLKMIANLLPREDENTVGGAVTVNGVESTDKDVIWTNIVSYVNQIERLHGYLTVKETIKFAFDCCYGQTHRGPFTPDGPEQDEAIAKMDEEDWLVNTIMRAVGIKRVEDTFVGGDRVRGVSGGEKKRVSVAEMMAARSYVDCLDEISTGLDAATTYDICKLLGEVTRMRNTVRIVSLLQPPPETVALFDEIILLDKGRVLYFGPVEEVTSHFKSLGYAQPPRMDPADWLQALPTKDGAKFLKNGEETVHLTNEQFVEKYNESPRGQDMLRRLESESPKGASLDHPAFHRRYANSTWESIKVVFFREFLLWRRDTYARKARLMQDLIMGLVVGTVFFQIDDPQTFMGVVFQCVFFVSMGAMLKVAPQIDVRGVFYKEQDANFYPTWIYVLARALAGIPTSLQDALIYGSLVYWMAGFTYQASSYLMFLLLILLCAFTCGVMFSFFSATIKDRPTAQACMSIALVVLVLFSGFTVQPDVIPPYYIWIYWINLFAWTIRAVVINEFESGEYDEVVNPQTGETQGEAIMRQFGFTLDGEPFHFVWTWWTVLFCIGLASVSIIMSVWCLNHVRFVTGGSLGGEEATVDQSMKTSKLTTSQAESLASSGATITFKNVTYVVTASTSKDKLHLLKGISGYFEKGKMTALMGSSGAGKTTLMDVLSLRKASGDVSGEIRINGFPQDADGFRRMSGYVEQFDTQSPQLTVRETVDFSAKMRLSEEIPVATKQKFVDHVLEMVYN